VKRYLTRSRLRGGAIYQPCDCSIEEHTKALLLASLGEVGPLYALE
jgi:hypothetical protein